MADKVIELLRLMEKFGVKPGKIIGAGDRKVTPIKKPILTKQLNRDYLLEDVEGGKIGTNTVKNEIEDVASLFFQKKLNDVEVNNLLNNLTYLDNALNPTNVVDLATKKPIVGEGLETLKEAEGLIAPPTTTVGRIQSKLNEAKRGLQDISGEPDLADLIKGAGKEQLSYSKLHNEGLVRAVARSILYEDIKAGKIKGMTLEQLGSAKDPIQDFRKIYGESALEQLDSLTPEFNQMYTPQEGATLARKKFTLTPDETRLPGSQTYEELEKIKKGEVVDMTSEVDKRKTIDDLIDEYNANQDRLSLTDEEGGTAIGYDEFRKLQDRNKQIADALENKGISSKIEEEVKPEGIVIPFKKKITEPEEFADGGITRTKFASGGKGKKVLDIINQANKKLKGKKSMETVNPKTGEVTVPDEFVTTAEEPRTLGGLPIDERSANISDEIDKLRASGINSLENEKKLNRLSLEFVDSLDPGRRKKALDYRRKSLDTENKLIIKAEEEGLDFDTYEKLRQGLYGLGKQKTLNFIKTGKVDLEPLKPVTTFEEAQKRFKTAAKAADEIFPDYNQPKTAASSLAEVMAEQKYGKVFDDISGDKQQELYEEAYNYITSINKLPKQSPAIIPEQVLEAEMNRVLNQYDKSMFIKNEQGMVDVTNPENVQKMALLLKRDHPELYKRLEGGAQTNVLEEFDVTGRKPNAIGGRVNFEKGSIPEEDDEEPSEEYIKSREAGRFKYSFDVQGPDSRTRKSGLLGRTNPKDYGLGITYLSNPSNETAPEIRVGASRRGAGIEIRKRFKDGGLGYLVGE